VKTEGCAQLVDLVATVLSGDEIPRTEPEDQGECLVVPAREDSKVARCGELDMRTGCRLIKC
jgi:hypothetical protein